MELNEKLILQKMAAGLTREMAIQSLENQAYVDGVNEDIAAAEAKAKKKAAKSGSEDKAPADQPSL